jgi:hypothetical protein
MRIRDRGGVDLADQACLFDIAGSLLVGSCIAPVLFQKGSVLSGKGIPFHRQERQKAVKTFIALTARKEGSHLRVSDAR